MGQGGNCNRCNGLLRVGRVSPEGGTSDLQMVARRSSHPIEKPLDQRKIFGTDRAFAAAIPPMRNKCVGVDGAGVPPLSAVVR